MDADTELVHKAQAGDSQAANELMSRYIPIAHKIVVRKIPEMDADDVSQDILLHAYKSINSFRFESSFNTWFHRISNNRIADYYRGEKRKAQAIETLREKSARMKRIATLNLKANIYSGTIPYRLINYFDNWLLGENSGDQEHSELEFSNMIKRLPRKYQRVITLRLWHGLRFLEIARLLGGSYESTRSMYRRAIKRLRESYD